MRYKSDESNDNFNIETFVRSIEDESLIWAASLFNKYNKEDFLFFLKCYPSLPELRRYLFENLKKARFSTFKEFEDSYYLSRDNHISPTHLKDLKNNNLMIAFYINNFINNKNDAYKDNIYHTVTKSDFIITKNHYFNLLTIIFFSDIESLRYDMNMITKLPSSYKNNPQNHKTNLNSYINNKEFQKWTFNYIINNLSPDNYPYYERISANEYYLYILSYFHSILYKNEKRYIFEIKKIKKAWQQKVLRDKGNAKASQLPLTKKTKTELIKLSEFRGISEAKVLKELIHQAYLNERCDENGKDLFD